MPEIFLHNFNLQGLYSCILLGNIKQIMTGLEGNRHLGQ